MRAGSGMRLEAEEEFCLHVSVHPSTEAINAFR